MQSITIDNEFKSLLPTLDKETYKLLEEDILENGCRDAVVLWNGVLIDGHNRYEICTRHDIPYKTVEKEFVTREDALIWIITNQVSRRNLTPIQLSHIRGLHYRTEKIIITNKGGKNQYSDVESHNGIQPKNESTAVRLGRHYNVSKNTIIRDLKVADAIDAIGEASLEAKRKILGSEVKLDKKTLAEISMMAKEDLQEIAVKIEEGRHKELKPEPQLAENEERPVDIVLAGMLPLDKAITRIANVFQSGLALITKKKEKTELQTALRSYIETLEGLYSRI